MVNGFATRVPMGRQFNGKKNNLLTNGSETTGYPHAKEWNSIPFSYHTQN